MGRRYVLIASAVLGALVGLGDSNVIMVAAIAATGFALSAVIGTRLGIEQLLTSIMLTNAVLVPMNSFRLTPLMNLSDALLIAAVPLLLLIRMSKPGCIRSAAYRKFSTSFALIACGGLFATFVSASPLDGVPGVLRFAISTMGVLWLVAIWGPDARMIRGMVWAYVLGASASVIVSFGGSAPEFRGRAHGLANHPNHFGTISMLGAGGAVALALGVGGKGRRLAIALSALLVVGVVLSGSRAALVGVMGTAAALAIGLRSGRFVVRTGLIICVLVLGAAAGASYAPEGNTIDRFVDPSGTRSAASDVERAELVQSAVTQISERPITGHGFEYALVAHSLYLQLWVSAGLLGVFGVGRLVYWTFRLLQRDPNDRFFVGMMAGFVGFLANAMLTNILWDRFIWTFLALALAASARPLRASRYAVGHSAPPPSADGASGFAYPSISLQSRPDRPYRAGP